MGDGATQLWQQWPPYPRPRTPTCRTAGWTWDILAELWEEGFSMLLDYIQEHGHPRVPHSYTTADGYRLGSWAATQRGSYNSGALDPDKQRRLADLPGWSWDAQHAKWEEGFRRLQEYVEHHGDAQVPGSYTSDGYQLGAWVITQRGVRAKGELSSDRQLLLQDLSGWTWNILDTKWEAGFRRLQEYVEHHGDARVPSDYSVDSYLLGRWSLSNEPPRPEESLTPIGSPGWLPYRAGPGIDERPPGRRVSGDLLTTSNSTVTPESKTLIRSTDTDLGFGLARNVDGTPGEHLNPIDSAYSRACRAGHGTSWM